MRESLFSPSWYRINTLKPRIRGHVEIHRHTYRGQTWFIVQDHASGRFQRFNAITYFLISLMDGEHTVEEIWQAGRAQFGEDAPTQDEMLHLLGHLHAANIMQSDVSPDTDEMMKRARKTQNARWKQNLRNPMAMRFSIFDPEKLLTRFEPYVRPLFGWIGALTWITIVAAGAVLAGVHWPELSENVADRILAPQNLIVLWLLYPCLKVVHEFGHAFAIKVLGGEVHEMGLMFLVLTPVPYVDASAILAFRNKWKRMLVGAMGIGVELFLASLSLMIWVNLEPGPVRGFFYNIIIVAGVSSILFNGNPLLRYDGYYILADFLEIPNLGSRGVHYFGYLIQHHLFGIRNVDPPPSTSGERTWFVVYTILSFLYRMIIYIGIIAFIAGKFLTIGILLAIWAAISMIGLPLFKAGKFLLSSPRLGTKRRRALVVSMGAAMVLIFVVCAIPLPLSTVSEGVLWFNDESFVRSRTEGFIEKLDAAPGSRVKPGDILVRCADPLLPARIKVLEAQMRELQVEYDMKERTDRVQAQVTMDDILAVKQQLDDAHMRLEELTIPSRGTGTFYVQSPQDLPGRFLKRGEVVGYVLNNSALSARVVVSQADVDLVRARTRSVKIRLPERISTTLPATLIREVPAGTEQLPARVLGQEGGGKVPIDPRDEKGMKAFQKLFLFDIQLPSQSHIYNVGSRVYVRFDHGYEPLAWRWYRGIRQVLLRRFSV